MVQCDYDVDAGLFYNITRYYDPQTGRFVTSDPVGLKGGINTYLYGMANPLSYTDPDGLDAVLPGPVPLPVPAQKPLIPTDDVVRQGQEFCKGAWDGAKMLWQLIFNKNSEKKRCEQARSECSDFWADKTFPTSDYGASFRVCLNKCLIDKGCPAATAGGW